jgi:hypothetical protein
MNIEGYVVLNDCRIEKQNIYVDEQATTCDFGPERPLYYIVELEDYTEIHNRERHAQIKVYKTLMAAKKQSLKDNMNQLNGYIRQLTQIENNIKFLESYGNNLTNLTEDDLKIKDVQLS